MAPHLERPLSGLFERGDSLTTKLESLHSKILLKLPCVDRISCAIYDPKTDLLKTFFNSTHTGLSIRDYEYPLSRSASLSRLKDDNKARVINSIQDEVQAGNQHSNWLLEQGYRSSLTIPLYSGEAFLGFLFFDSCRAGAFTQQLQDELMQYCCMIEMMLCSEMAAVNSLLATAQAAREFAHLRDFETGAHLDRMAHLSRLIARKLKDQHDLSDENIQHIFLFSPLHDIGKIGVPDRILLKKGALDPDERKEMDKHVENGVGILKKVLGGYSLDNLADSQIMLDIVAHHHEFMDGSGYPNALSGEQIPIAARIVTVADIFDALTSKRPYKEAWSIDEAFLELDRMVAEEKLDSDCVEVLKRNRLEVEKIVQSMTDA